MKTSVNLPDELVREIQEWNDVHPDRAIMMSKTCQKALEEAIRRAKGEYVK